MKQLSAFDFGGKVIEHVKPAGLQRAAKAASEVDGEILRWFRRHVGRVASKAELHADVVAALGHELDPDTTRRRRDALATEGEIRFERIEGKASLFRVLP